MANVGENKTVTTDIVKNLEQDKSREAKNSKEQKFTVLENNGYTVGRSIGSGSYATVKVRYI